MINKFLKQWIQIQIMLMHIKFNPSYSDVYLVLLHTKSPLENKHKNYSRFFFERTDAYTIMNIYTSVWEVIGALNPKSTFRDQETETGEFLIRWMLWPQNPHSLLEWKKRKNMYIKNNKRTLQRIVCYSTEKYWWNAVYMKTVSQKGIQKPLLLIFWNYYFSTQNDVLRVNRDQGSDQSLKIYSAYLAV